MMEGTSPLLEEALQEAARVLGDEGEPWRAAFAPGRLNLIGAHVDHSGGPVLPIGLPQGTLVLARPGQGKGFRFLSLREGLHLAESIPSRGAGMVGLRWVWMPLINRPPFCGVEPRDPCKILIVTEYNKHIQGFLVSSVDTIKRLAWEDVKAPPPMLAHQLGGLVTAVTELDDGRLVMIMDVEKVLAETADFYQDDHLYDAVQPLGREDMTVLYADDSSVARGQIERTLERLGVRSIPANNGAEAWSKLQTLARRATGAGRPVSDLVQAVITDVEMPEMDGYVLTRRIKDDDRFDGIPVIMHSSLSAEANQAIGTGVGADAYVPKFEPIELAAAVQRILKKHLEAA